MCTCILTCSQITFSLLLFTRELLLSTSVCTWFFCAIDCQGCITQLLVIKLTAYRFLVLCKRAADRYKKKLYTLLTATQYIRIGRVPSRRGSIRARTWNTLLWLKIMSHPHFFKTNKASFCEVWKVSACILAARRGRAWYQAIGWRIQAVTGAQYTDWLIAHLLMYRVRWGCVDWGVACRTLSIVYVWLTAWQSGIFATFAYQNKNAPENHGPRDHGLQLGGC